MKIINIETINTGNNINIGFHKNPNKPSRPNKEVSKYHSGIKGIDAIRLPAGS